MQDKISVLIISDDICFRNLLEQLLKKETPFPVSALSPDEPDVLLRIGSNNPALILLDIDLKSGKRRAIELGRRIRLETNVQLILLGEGTDRLTVIEASRESFASGYVFKEHYPRIAGVVRDTIRGNTPQKFLIQEIVLAPLTNAERSVVRSMLAGSDELRSSPKTLANQKTSIFRKLHLKNQQELIHIFTHY